MFLHVSRCSSFQERDYVRSTRNQCQTPGFLSSRRRFRSAKRFDLQSATTGFAEGTRQAVAILGAAGYTGSELVRLLLRHPHVEIKALSGTERTRGRPYGQVYPQYAFESIISANGKQGPSPVRSLPPLCLTEEVDFSQVDTVFCCLPHATTQSIVTSILQSAVGRTPRVIDLSADFRLADVHTYAHWYGTPHRAPDLQAEAVYGLTEFARADIRSARLVANPGCYPTGAQLALVPLIRAQLIALDDMIIDAKSGVTGAGRSAKEANLFCEVTEGMHAYAVANHRHAPEIEQGLSRAAGLGNSGVVVNFTPHLVPMARGILETIYVRCQAGVTPGDLRACLEQAYGEEKFVHVLADPQQVPQTRYVRGSNHVVMNVFPDRLQGRAILVVAFDNIVKGASGQAVQNMNVMMGIPEHTALEQGPLFP
jgi:N-acetyl-gamma-glutamyl-phosphate reductase